MEKVAVFGQSNCVQVKWLYSGKIGCNRAKVVFFGQSGCIRTNWLYSGKRGCLRKKWLYSGKVVVFGKGGCTWA